MERLRAVVSCANGDSVLVDEGCQVRRVEAGDGEGGEGGAGGDRWRGAKDAHAGHLRAGSKGDG